MSGVLHISNEGMLEPHGQHQMVAYLEKLKWERRVYLAFFEKSKDPTFRARMQATRKRVRRPGIVWTPLRYHSPLSKLAAVFDVSIGTLLALTVLDRHRLTSEAGGHVRAVLNCKGLGDVIVTALACGKPRIAGQLKLCACNVAPAIAATPYVELLCH
jgi:hypothetical protein